MMFYPLDVCNDSVVFQTECQQSRTEFYSACFETEKIITNGDWRLVYQKGRPSRRMRTSATQCRWCSQMKTDPGDSITKTWPFPLRIPSRSGCHGLFWEGKHPPIEFILQGPVPVPQGYIAKAHEFRLVFTSLQMWDFLRPQVTNETPMKHRWDIYQTNLYESRTIVAHA